jgi:rhodanese-related sulfurtransferase
MDSRYILAHEAYNAALKGALLIDVREELETSDVWMNMDNVLHIPFSSFAITKKELPSDKQIILCCAIGIVSEKAANELIKLNYTNVFVLKNGLIAWKIAGLPLKTSADLSCKCSCCKTIENED